MFSASFPDLGEIDKGNRARGLLREGKLRQLDTWVPTV